MKAGRSRSRSFLLSKRTPAGLNGFHIFALAPVDGAVLVAHHKHGRLHGLLEVFLQLVGLLDVLRLLDDDHLALGHHRVAACGVGHLRGIDVGAEHHNLVEVALLGLQGVLGYIVADLVYVV